MSNLFHIGPYRSRITLILYKVKIDLSQFLSLTARRTKNWYVAQKRLKCLHVTVQYMSVTAYVKQCPESFYEIPCYMERARFLSSLIALWAYLR